MNYYDQDFEAVLKNLNTNEHGLLESDAKVRQKKYGFNKLADKKKESNLSKFLNEFKDIMIILLLIAAIISFIVSKVNNESILDSIVIISIVVINATIGFIQERKSDKSVEALKQMQVTNVKVRREECLKMINSEDLVPGDILILEAGDKVPADARIIHCSSLKVDESILTGESLLVEKNESVIDGNTNISERYNMLYFGTSISYGKCEAVVCKIGMDTEFGKIAKSLDKKEKETTPLQEKINDISKFLSYVILIIIFILFIVGIIRQMKVIEIAMLSISLAVAAIPEGLPAIITIVLSLGMERLSKKKAIVRKLSSVETLGSTEIICSDKTGTITQNKMVVREIYFDNKVCHAEDLNKDNILLKSMLLNNDSEKNKNSYVGDPTEIALYQCAENKVNIKDIRKNNPRIGELPFDSERKMMSTINECSKDIKLYTKGSFDSLIERCSYIYEDNKIKKLSPKKKKELKEIEMAESNNAYRVLAFAYKELKSSYKLSNELENNLIFVGLACMIDPPREDVKEAIIECKKAGIRPIMITGDSLSTAISIAKEIGILDSEHEAITGVELDKMTKDEFKKNVDKYSVYARVSPMNKLNIVEAWKKKNKIVAMTGDGVNDAPSIKAANIGIGMGISGTEVSKGVSDIILADDSFSTIVSGIKEGRRIFDNIRNVLVYLLTGNIMEILVVFVGILLGIEIFDPIQLLYINLITDSIPAIALAFEKASDDIMMQKVRKKSSTFFTKFLISRIVLASILKASAVLLVYFVNVKIYDVGIATTMSFLTTICLEIIFAFSCKNLKKIIVNKNMISNKQLNISAILLIIIQAFLFFTPIGGIFDIVELNGIQILSCLFVVLTIFLIDELTKNITTKYFED